MVSDFDQAVSFYTDIAGLKLHYKTSDSSHAQLSGSLAGRDLALLSATDERRPGMHHLAFELGSEGELAEAEKRLEAEGIEPELVVDHPTKRAVFLKDPDGMRLEFYVAGGASPETLEEAGNYDLEDLL